MNIMTAPGTRLPHDVWETARCWLAEHGKAALATVVETWGSAPVPAGGQLVVAPGDRFEGSVSGGCVEVDVLVEAAEAMAEGRPKLLEYGVSDDVAWRAGLACGGTVKVLIEPLTPADAPMLDAVIEARRARTTIVITTRIADAERRLYSAGGEIPAPIAARLASGMPGLVDDAAGQMFVHPLLPPLRVIVAGATHIGQVFADMARLVGYAVTVVDPRPIFATEERFGAACTLAEWPQASFDEMAFDERTAVVALTHAAHIDDEVLAAALRSPCMYIGALGSRTTHGKRLQRLQAAGFDDNALNRIHAPIGLNIGAKGPAEIAVSILAEVIQAARGG